MTNVTCVHHWIIEIPNGAKSDATCKKCGATRQFHNTFGEAMWNNKGPSIRTISPDERDLELAS